MVKCAECGLVGLRDAKSGELIIVGERCRQTGEKPRNWNNDVDHFLCAIKGTAFSRNTQECGEQFNSERDCLAFLEFQRCFGPKEHLQMMFDQRFRMEQEQRLADQRKHDQWFNAILGIALAVIAGGFGLLGTVYGVHLGRSNAASSPSIVAPERVEKPTTP